MLYAGAPKILPPAKLSILLLRLPAHAIAGTTSALLAQPCAYTLRVKRDLIEREGYAALGELAALIGRAKNVVLLLAAADVSVLRMAIPPLSPAKLRAALPNLVEEKLLCDVAECAVVCSADTAGSRNVAVVRREWLTMLLKTLRDLGAQRISALPEQLCLAYEAGQASAAISEYENGISLTLRLSEHEGMGLVLNSPDELPHILRCLVPASPINLYVPPASLHRYQTALAQDTGIHVGADNGTRWQIPKPALDLAAGSGAQYQPQWNWRPWRWPLVLAALLLLVHTSALNLDWWRMNREASGLRANMKQIYLAAYPKESVVLDPLLQMRQKITAAEHDAGFASADDFTTLITQFRQAWESAMPAPDQTVAGIEYRERGLSVQLKSAAPAAAMKAILAERDLSLEQSPDSALTWQIRSIK